VISSNDYKFGKNKGKGEDLLVDNLLITCLNVYKNPTSEINYILHKVSSVVQLVNLVMLTDDSILCDSLWMIYTLNLWYYYYSSFDYIIIPIFKNKLWD
jgi:hypothetical protein